MGLNVHRGWHIYVNRSTCGPRYQANRHGVGMCADDLALLTSMIDKRMEHERACREMREVLAGERMGAYHGV